MVVFSGRLGDPDFFTRNNLERDFELDPDTAAADLQRAGYEVSRLPDKYGGRLEHPLDDYIEAVTEGPNDPKVIGAIFKEVEVIVRKYGGSCFEWGPIEEGHVPFAYLFEGQRE
jgi:hypothetical protein